MRTRLIIVELTLRVVSTAPRTPLVRGAVRPPLEAENMREGRQTQ